MSIQPPPVQQPIITPPPDKPSPGSLNTLWALFFNQIYQGDAGSEWIPTVQNLAVTGTSPSFVGRYYRLNQYLVYFRASIIPANGGNTSSTMATTYIDNFPLVISANGICASMVEEFGGSLGMCSQATNKIWLPTWTTITSAVTIVGIVEAS